MTVYNRVFAEVYHNDCVYNRVFAGMYHNDCVYNRVFAGMYHNDCVCNKVFAGMYHNDCVYNRVLPWVGKSMQTPFREWLAKQKEKLHHKPGTGVAEPVSWTL